MHVLHRSHDVRRALLAAVAAATLAIVLAMVFAAGFNDLNSAPTPASAPTQQTVAHASTISSLASNPFTHSPFTNLFTAPVRLPWASTAP